MTNCSTDRIRRGIHPPKGHLGQRLTGLVLASLAIAWCGNAAAQQIEQGVAIVGEKISSRVDAFSYQKESTTDLDLRGTTIAPRLAGSVRVKTTGGRTELKAKLEHVTDPAGFGPFAVYVLWVITPEGRATNVGAFDLDGDRGRIETATPLSAFALIVTAEPHFAVSVPGQFVVAQNVGAANVKIVPLSVTSLASRADYTGLTHAVRDKKQPAPLELEMARYAVAIAESADAPNLALGAYGRAREALAAAEAAFGTHKSRDRSAVAENSRDAIQSAEDARAAAEVRRNGAELRALKQTLAATEQTAKEAEAAHQAALAEVAATRLQLRAATNRLPTATSRLALAKDLLARWIPIDPTDPGVLAHLPPDSFTNAKPELLPASEQRLAVAAGILIGVGGFSVVVSPSLQLGEDLKQLALAQQRARVVMDWLASLGVKAAVGAPPASATPVDAVLSTGPGVDLSLVQADTAGPAETADHN